MWHDKDPSRLKDCKRRAKAQILQRFAGNDDVSINMAFPYSQAGRQTTYTQTTRVAQRLR